MSVRYFIKKKILVPVQVTYQNNTTLTKCRKPINANANLDYKTNINNIHIWYVNFMQDYEPHQSCDITA